MKSLGFHHVALQVSDVERVAAFYRDVLRLPELARHTFPDGRLRSIWVGAVAGGDASGGFIAVERSDATSRGALGCSMVALRIEPSQRRAVQAQLEAQGLTIVRQTGWTMYVNDPEGNLVGLSHHPHDAP